MGSSVDICNKGSSRDYLMLWICGIDGGLEARAGAKGSFCILKRP